MKVKYRKVIHTVFYKIRDKNRKMNALGSHFSELLFNYWQSVKEISYPELLKITPDYGRKKIKF